MRTALILACLLSLGSGRQEPPLAKDRVVLHTSMGDLYLALYSEVAPNHVIHFRRLARKGLYDGSHFDLVIPGFLIRNAGDAGRSSALSAEQYRIAQERIKGEFSTQRHVRGTLSMSREADDVNSARTSFAIMLADAPHLDGKYTVFGRVEGGFDVLDAIANVPCDADRRPRQRVDVVRAEVIGAGGRDGPPEIPGTLIPMAAAFIGVGLAAFFLAGRILPRRAGTLGLILVFFGFLLGFIAAGLASPEARTGGVALAVFLGALAFFKLMNRFESSR